MLCNVLHNIVHGLRVLYVGWPDGRLVDEVSCFELEGKTMERCLMNKDSLFDERKVGESFAD
jgi:hypothetical protein